MVAATLSELGLPAPTNIIQTMLMHDGYFVGWNFRYDGGYAILHTGGGTMGLHDDQGKLLKTVVSWNRAGSGGVELPRLRIVSAKALPLPRPSTGTCPTCRGFFVADRKAPLIRKQAGHFSGRILLPSSMKIPGYLAVGQCPWPSSCCEAHWTQWAA